MLIKGDEKSHHVSKQKKKDSHSCLEALLQKTKMVCAAETEQTKQFTCVIATCKCFENNILKYADDKKSVGVLFVNVDR